MIYFDTETCGLTGPVILIQYAQDDGPIILHSVWSEPISKTLALIEKFVGQPVVGFNLVFDWFHINKLYNIFRYLSDRGYNDVPVPEVIAKIDAMNPSEYCVRPVSACDLMLHARRGKFQSLMARKNVIIKSVPDTIAYDLAEELKQRIKIDDIYFSKRQTGYHWDITPTKNKTGFSDITLRFAASTSLSALAQAMLGEDKADWPIDKRILPTELSHIPYGQHGFLPWLSVIYRHISIWEMNETARYYAWRDVDLTRKLYKAFNSPEPGDDDSILACDVGAARWRGFSIDKTSIPRLIDKYASEVSQAPRAPSAVMRGLNQYLSEDEQKIVTSTRKDILETISSWENHGAAEFARSVISARKAEKRVDLLKKLSSMRSFHPDFKIIGTRSNRMAGGGEDGPSTINPQGIPKGHEFRNLITLAYTGEELYGGDAVSYEAAIMAAIWNDPELNADLKSGKKFHGLMGSVWYNKPYEEIMLDTDKYNRGKNTTFGWAYGAQDDRIAKTAGISVEEATINRQRLGEKYKCVADQQKLIADKFCSMRQPGGIGTKVIWHEPADYIESIFGFRRYFTLENTICKELFTLANRPPKYFKDVPDKVIRRDRFQTAGGATQSALFAAAFNIQAANLRQAGNHQIQSPGGQITKSFQRSLNDLQPKGIHKWIIRTMNIHDELLAVTDGSVNTFSIRDKIIEKYKEYIPMLDWEWEKLTCWGDK